MSAFMRMARASASFIFHPPESAATGHLIMRSVNWKLRSDASTSAAIEEAFQNGLYHILLGTAPRQYAVYPKRMKQVNEATAFERDLLREETAARPTADVERGARRPPDVDPAEPCMVLRVGSIVQIARQRKDGWAFGSLTMEAPVTQPGLARNFSDGGLPAGWSLNQGWFELDKTDVPTADQLAELQKRTGGADALATPSYWDDVKDKTVAQTFALNSSSPEYKRVEDAFPDEHFLAILYTQSPAAMILTQCAACAKPLAHDAPRRGAGVRSS